MKKNVYVTKRVIEEREVFTFEDLPEEVKDKLIKEERSCEDDWFWDFFDDEIKFSWKAIADVFNAKLDYEYSLCGNSYTKLKTNLEEEVLSLEDNRAMAYIWNNWIEPNLKGRYYSMSHKERRSNIKMEFDCPFTGVYCDNVLWDAWEEWIKEYRRCAKKGSYVDVDDFIHILEGAMTKVVTDEAEYKVSDEYISEEIASREDFYFEDGEIAEIA